MTLDLAGHTMTCTGSDFAGICQAATFGTAAGITVAEAVQGMSVVRRGAGGGWPYAICSLGTDPAAPRH